MQNQLCGMFMLRSCLWGQEEAHLQPGPHPGLALSSAPSCCLRFLSGVS